MVVGERPDDLGLIEQFDATLQQGLLHLLYLGHRSPVDVEEDRMEEANIA
jgi:hypothetical protein